MISFYIIRMIDFWKMIFNMEEGIHYRSFIKTDKHKQGHSVFFPRSLYICENISY